MDPQQKIALDPKLKEAYDSVMGVNLPPVSQPPVNPPPSQEPIVSPITWPTSGPQIISPPRPPIHPQEPIYNINQSPPPFSPVIISQPLPLTPTPQPSMQSDPQIPTPKIVAFNSSIQGIQQNNQVQGKKWRLRWALVVFLIVAFLLGYAIFWIKVFGIKLPILSNFL